MEIYPAKYTDKHGEFETMIRNDWKILRMNVRGVEFSGSSFDYFQPDKKVSKQNLNSFSISVDNELSDFQIEFKISVKVIENDKESEEFLNIRFERKTISDLYERYDCRWLLNLKHHGQEIGSTVDVDFDGCLGEIAGQFRKRLADFTLKCCHECRLSDYSVYGQDAFGSLICFKNHKERFLSMKTQYDYYDLLEEKNLERVQEIYLCGEFQTRNLQAKNLNQYVD